MPHAFMPENLHMATVKIAEIKLDIIKGCFDTSLEKYKAISEPKVQVASSSHGQITKPIYLHNLTDNFNDWAKNVRNVDVEASVDYLYVRRLMGK
jgi:integrase